MSMVVFTVFIVMSACSLATASLDVTCFLSVPYLYKLTICIGYTRCVLCNVYGCFLCAGSL